MIGVGRMTGAEMRIAARSRRHHRGDEPRGRRTSARYWKGTAFSSMLEPIVYLLCFGLGLGATLDRRRGRPQVRRVRRDRMVATAVIFSSALPAMFGTFVKERFQNTYDAILAAPVDVEELVTAEMLWIGLRAGFYGCFPLIVGMFFGLDPKPAMLLVPIFCVRHGARLRRLRHLGGGERRQDRPVQLRDDADHHPALPGRGHVLPDRPASRGAPGRGQLQSALPAGRAGPPRAFGFEASDPIRLPGWWRSRSCCGGSPSGG